MQNREIIYKLLQQKCEAISVRPKEPTKDFRGLVGFKDDLSFPVPESLSDAAKLFDLAQKAIAARFAFARENHRLQRGESENYCFEYVMAPAIDPETNKPNGDVVLAAQCILREVNPASSPAAESPPSPPSQAPSPESPHP